MIYTLSKAMHVITQPPPPNSKLNRADVIQQISYAEFRMRRPVDIAELSYWTGYKSGMEWVLSELKT